MGKPSEGMPVQNKKMAVPLRKKIRSEERGTSCFRGQVNNLFASNAYQAQIDRNICESDD
jgi:hypothetical protein